MFRNIVKNVYQRSSFKLKTFPDKASFNFRNWPPPPKVESMKSLSALVSNELPSYLRNLSLLPFMMKAEG
jgi:hypothetical protein